VSTRPPSPVQGLPADPPPGIAAAAALAQPSRRRIADALAQRVAGLGVAEIAERVDLHPSAVRRHLQKLSDAGVVSAEREESRGRGRPRLRYRLVDMQAPRVAAHQEIVRLLVAYLVRSGANTDDLEAFGRTQGGFLATGADAAGILQSFTRLGFAPRETGSSADASRGRLEMRLGHCPFKDAVTVPGGDIICRLHRGLADGIAAHVAPGSHLTAFEPEDPARAGCRLVLDGLRTGDAVSRTV